MKKIKSLLIVLFVGACVMSSCSLNDTSVEAQKSGSSGRTLEILLAANENVYKGETKEFIDSLFEQP